jgi:hypothetical protein
VTEGYPSWLTILGWENIWRRLLSDIEFRRVVEGPHADTLPPLPETFLKFLAHRKRYDSDAQVVHVASLAGSFENWPAAFVTGATRKITGPLTTYAPPVSEQQLQSRATHLVRRYAVGHWPGPGDEMVRDVSDELRAAGPAAADALAQHKAIDWLAKKKEIGPGLAQDLVAARARALAAGHQLPSGLPGGKPPAGTPTPGHPIPGTPATSHPATSRPAPIDFGDELRHHYGGLPGGRPSGDQPRTRIVLLPGISGVTVPGWASTNSAGISTRLSPAPARRIGQMRPAGAAPSRPPSPSAAVRATVWYAKASSSAHVGTAPRRRTCHPVAPRIKAPECSTPSAGPASPSCCWRSILTRGGTPAR